jgi:hypothetical protein
MTWSTSNHGAVFLVAVRDLRHTYSPDETNRRRRADEQRVQSRDAR